jgi:hypothetical protein
VGSVHAHIQEQSVSRGHGHDGLVALQKTLNLR